MQYIIAAIHVIWISNIIFVTNATFTLTRKSHTQIIGWLSSSQSPVSILLKDCIDIKSCKGTSVGTNIIEGCSSAGFWLLQLAIWGCVNRPTWDSSYIVIKYWEWKSCSFFLPQTQIQSWDRRGVAGDERITKQDKCTMLCYADLMENIYIWDGVLNARVCMDLMLSPLSHVIRARLDNRS